jgi:hypothetical protein
LIFEKKLIQSIDDSSIVVLRQGRARIADQLIQIFLISDALSYDGCDWLMPNKPQNAPNNKSLSNVNSQSESVLRRSNSDGSMLKNNVSKQDKKQSPGHQRRVSNSGQLQIDEVMMLFDDEVNDDDKSKTPLFPDSETSPSQERKTQSMSSNDVQQSVVGVAPQRTSKFGGLFRRSTGLGNVANSPSSSDRHDHKQSASDLVRSIKK